MLHTYMVPSESRSSIELPCSRGQVLVATAVDGKAVGSCVADPDYKSKYNNQPLDGINSIIETDSSFDSCNSRVK